MPFDPKKLEAFLKKKKSEGAGSSATGGKGTVRRKHKAARKAQTHDDKKLKATLNKLNVRDIPAIEEVNLFKDDGTVIHFAAPKVQASIAANTYVVMGSAETKRLQDLLPGIINQLGPDNLEELKKIYASFQQSEGGPGAKPEDDDDEVPELVENFEDVSKGAGAAGASSSSTSAASAAPAPAAKPKEEPKKPEPKAEADKPQKADAPAPEAKDEDEDADAGSKKGKKKAGKAKPKDGSQAKKGKPAAKASKKKPAKEEEDDDVPELVDA